MKLFLMTNALSFSTKTKETQTIQKDLVLSTTNYDWAYCQQILNWREAKQQCMSCCRIKHLMGQLNHLYIKGYSKILVLL